MYNIDSTENNKEETRSPLYPPFEDDTEIKIEPSIGPVEDIFESDELASIRDEIVKELKAHITEINPVLLVIAGVFGFIGLTSWDCNYDKAVPQLLQHFQSAFDVELDPALSDFLIEQLRISAGSGGAGGNLVLNYFGTRGLKARWNTIKESFTGGSYGYLSCYVVIAISAGIAATSNGFVVAEAATTLTMQLIKFILNFGAALGAHMLFAIPFLGLLERSPVGDISKLLLQKMRESLSLLREKSIACLLTEEEYQAVLDVREKVGNKAFNPRLNLPSAVFNINRRLIIRAGYALASLEDSNVESNIKKQITTTVAILEKLSSENNNADNPFDNYPKKNLENLTPNSEIKYLLKLSEFISTLTLDHQALFFLRAAKKLNVQPESTLEGSFLTLANTVSLPFSVISCLANLTSINKAFGDMFSLVTSNPKTIEEIGLSFALAGAPAKSAMYWNSLLSSIERVFFLPYTLKWLWQSSKTVKVLIPTTGIASFYAGAASGACYALDYLNSFGSILYGYLLEFCELFGAEGVIIGTTIFVSIGWVIGAGMVNGNALSTVIPDLVLSIIHTFQPKQKANDALCKQAILIASKMVANMVPDSVVGKKLEQIMAEYQGTLHEQKIQKREATERTYNSKESCGQWAVRMATFGFCDNRKSKPTNDGYEEINGDTSSLPNMATIMAKPVSFNKPYSSYDSNSSLNQLTEPDDYEGPYNHKTSCLIL